MKDFIKRLSSRKFLVSVAAGLAVWTEADINAVVKVGITSALAAIYTTVEGRLDAKQPEGIPQHTHTGLDTTIQVAHTHDAKKR